MATGVRFDLSYPCQNHKDNSENVLIKKKGGKFSTEGTKAIPTLLTTHPPKLHPGVEEACEPNLKERKGLAGSEFNQHLDRWLWSRNSLWSGARNSSCLIKAFLAWLLPNKSSAARNCQNRRPSGPSSNQQVQHFFLSLRTLSLQHHWWEGTYQRTSA